MSYTQKEGLGKNTGPNQISLQELLYDEFSVLIDDSDKPESKWIYDLPNEQYHADKTAVSSSVLRKILKSPKSFKCAYTEGFNIKDTDALRFGRLAHQCILEGPKFRESYMVMPDFSVEYGHHASNIYKQAKAAWLKEHEGKTIVTQKELDDLDAMINAIVKNDDAYMLLKNGIVEASGYYTDSDTGIRCRIRPDFMNLGLMALVDLKTTQDCSLEEFSKSIWNFRYDFQMAMYGEGIEQIVGKPVEFHAFIAIEKQKPFEVAVYTLEAEVIKKGRHDYRRALERLKESIKANNWHGVQRGIQNIGFPPWVNIQ